jgi:hypothetical protein
MRQKLKKVNAEKNKSFRSRLLAKLMMCAAFILNIHCELTLAVAAVLVYKQLHSTVAAVLVLLFGDTQTA